MRSLLWLLVFTVLAGCAGGSGGGDSDSAQRLARGTAEIGLVYMTAKRLEGHPEKAARVEALARGALLAISPDSDPVSIDYLAGAAINALDVEDLEPAERTAAEGLIQLFAQELSVRVPADELGHRWLVEPYRTEVENTLKRVEALARSMQ